MEICSRILLTNAVRCTSLQASRCYYLAEKFQPKLKKQLFSYEDIKLHPVDRCNKPKQLKNVAENGEPINIGFKVKQIRHPAIKRTEAETAKFEENSRLMKLQVNTQEAFEEFVKYENRSQVQNIIRCYGIFDSLFQGAEFTNVCPIDATFQSDNKVFFGNIIEPSNAQSAPDIKLNLSNITNKNFHWTLFLVCPDGNLFDENGEVLHWAVSNINATDSTQNGDELVSYLPPLPFRGTGFHRYVLLAFHHENKIDLQGYINSLQKDTLLESRSFSTLDFIQKFESDLTPISVSFFQSQWDETVTKTFHETLKSKEPGFEWDCPPRYVPPFEKFPRGANISYFHRYDPDFYMRHEKDTYIEASWDKIWNNESYSKTIVENVEDLECRRRKIAWRQDYNEQFLTEKQKYNRQVKEILREFDYKKEAKRSKPKYGYLV